MNSLLSTGGEEICRVTEQSNITFLVLLTVLQKQECMNNPTADLIPIIIKNNYYPNCY